MKGKVGKSTTAKGRGSKTPITVSKSARGESSHSQGKSPAKSKTESKEGRKQGYARRTGDSVDTKSIKRESPDNRGKSAAQPGKMKQGSKSPGLSRVKTEEISNVSIKKNAPREIKEQTLKSKKGAKRTVPRKDIQIIIETPSKKQITKATQAAKSPSMAKQRIKAISKPKGSSEFVKKIKTEEDVIKPNPKVQIRGGRKPKIEEPKVEKSALKTNNKRERSRHDEEAKTPKKQKTASNIRPSSKATQPVRRPLPGVPVRTPTKKFAKDKTPSPQSSEESEESIQRIKPKKVVKQSPPAKVKRETPSKQQMIKEESPSESDEKSSVKEEEPKIVKRPVKHQLGYNVDVQGISAEVSKILRNIETKKKKAAESKPKETKAKTQSKAVTKTQAADFNFKLQKKEGTKVEHIVKLSDLSEKPLKTHSDVLLAILEVATNYDYYNLPSTVSSRAFWEDVTLYDELKNIFGAFKGETLRKYWRFLNSNKDPVKIADLVKKHKAFIDRLNIKLLSIIGAIRDFFNGEGGDFEEAIKNMQVEVRKKEIFEEVLIDSETGDLKRTKIEKTTTRKRKKFEESSKVKKFEGRNYQGPVDEVLGMKESEKEHGGFLEVNDKMKEEEGKRFEYLSTLNAQEKTNILEINQDDKFLFRIIDKTADTLNATFPQYHKGYIIDVLNGNSMNIEKTFRYLSDPVKNNSMLFNSADDNLIKNMKGTPEFKNLEKEKGSDRVREREDYLIDS